MGCKYNIFLINYDRVGIPGFHRWKQEPDPGMAFRQASGASKSTRQDSAYSSAISRNGPLDETVGEQLGWVSRNRGNSNPMDEYAIQATRISRPSRTPVHFALSGAGEGRPICALNAPEIAENRIAVIKADRSRTIEHSFS